MSSPFSSADIKTLQARAQLTSALRAYFETHGYWEVSTPLLSHDICVDQWLDPFQVMLGNRPAFLQTSPEFAMKRLLCSGADAIFEITKSFRQDELGQFHNPEFTILEWYMCHTDHHDQMAFVEGLVRALIAHAESLEVLPPAPFQRLTYQAAFQRFAGCDPLVDSESQLLRSATHHGVQIPVDSDRDQILNQLLAEVVEPQFKEIPALFLYDYPASQAALAIVREEVSPVAERFELYLYGVEICNGYHELTDPVELRRRMLLENERRVARQQPELPMNSRLLEAMEHGMPPAAGVALGLDRFIMFLLGKNEISAVIPFPIDRA